MSETTAENETSKEVQTTSSNNVENVENQENVKEINTQLFSNKINIFFSYLF